MSKVPRGAGHLRPLTETMAYLSLYRKYRPQGFDDIDGQPHVTRTLRNAVRLGQIAHAYLFTGPRGTGKTSTARVLAAALNCTSSDKPTPDPCHACEPCRRIRQGSALDVIEIDAASNRGIDEIRALRERVQYAPAEGRYKVYIIDEVHMLTTEAFNALLKTLEEPPPHVVFVMCTTEPHRLLPTILSRCQRFDFRLLPLEQIVGRLKAIADQEKFTADDEALALLARAGAGSMRDAISLLDQASNYADAAIGAREVQAMLGGVDLDLLLGLADAILERDLGKGFGLIDEAVNLGKEPRQLTAELIGHLRALLMVAAGDRERALLGLPAQQAAQVVEQARQFERAGLAEALRALADAEREMRWSSQPRLLLELAFVRLCAPAEGLPPPARRAQPAPARPQPARPAAEAEAPLLEPGSEVTVEALREHWPALLERLRRRYPQLVAFLSECSPEVIRGDKLVLAFRVEFHYDQMRSAKRQETVQAFLEEEMGRRFEIECALHAPEAAPASEAQQQVRTALNMFPGSEVVDSERSSDAGAAEG
jgi:DNA polymerase-3 subunit gamma/tau